MNFTQRVKAFVRRNRGAVLQNVWHQVRVRVWIRYRLWRIISPFFHAREPKTWVFMGGCYNSGTTILREMIGAHPDVASLPREGVEMTDVFPNLEVDGWVRMWYRNADKSDLSDRDPVVLARRAKRDWAPWWRRDAQAFIEKSIVHGAWMPALDAGFPNARFIGVIRNGYCVCEGIRRRASPNGAAREILGRNDYPIDEVGRQWVFANEVLIRDHSRVQNYRAVQYEDFTANPIETIRALFDFIGVNPDAVTKDIDGVIVIGSPPL